MTGVSHLANQFEQYHAHVYFDAATVEQARRFCDEAQTALNLPHGRFHERCVGPHTRWSCLFVFSAERFDEVTRWMDEHRQGLSVFVHGVSGDDLADHTDHIGFLGELAALDVRQFMAR